MEDMKEDRNFGGAGRMGRDIADTVRKLLNQAADREGTPEGDAFRDKAFALIARHGLDPDKLGDPADAGARMTSLDLDMSGSYGRQQIGLLNVLGRALHCEVVHWSGRAGAGARGTVIGAVRHVDRVRLLFSVLCPHMLAGAAELRSGSSAVTARWRRSFMVGFAVAVGERLEAQEKAAADHATATTAAGSGTGANAALVLVGDAERARDELHRRFPLLRRSTSKARLDGDAFMHGAAAGRNTDLGQERMGARRALGA
ncbi:DUF2786 domain-containing protein [uncultured Corynebacterium sp.]|uniref:DUF2786 domain-containing protein n=1 Tax=uncultured Corynebacterium sp. TaxID=159447 RepID=UPI0025F34A35|nr:DUF2786 domain-containing protein [uncultured Corynebacterium sp.]